MCLVSIQNFCTFKRPGKPIQMEVKDLVLARPGARPLRLYAVVLHSAVVLRSSKTTEFDVTIPVEMAHYRLIGEALAKRLRLRMINFLMKAANELRLTCLGDLHPVKLRNNRNSNDYASSQRPPQKSQNLSRRQCFQGPRRHEQGGHLDQILRKLLAAVSAPAPAAEGLPRQAQW